MSELWPIDLGEGVRARLLRSGDLMTAHRSDQGRPCGGYVRMSGKNPSHAIVTEIPLTISPNITCQTCHASGFIKEGRWIPL